MNLDIQVARLNENYVLSLSNPGESRKLINVFPSASHGRLLLGTLQFLDLLRSLHLSFQENLSLETSTSLNE
jgi:hypothetical protein